MISAAPAGYNLSQMLDQIKTVGPASNEYDFARCGFVSVTRRAHDRNRHHGADDDRLDRTFAVKPRACGAPLRGRPTRSCRRV
jgi:hypothetical protein